MVRTFVLAAAILLVPSVPALAQGTKGKLIPITSQPSGSTTSARPAPPPPSQGPSVDPFVTGMHLTAAQQTAVTEIHTKYRACMKARLDSAFRQSRPPRQTIPDLTDLQLGQVAELRLLFTGAQQSEFDRNVETIRATHAQLLLARSLGLAPPR